MWYFISGLCLSVTYVTLIFIGRPDILEQFTKLKLNELGDFLAGAFSPLAFLWLVIGYMMQGKELKLNREALKLQAEELSKSVLAQNELVEQSKVQIDFEKAKLEEEKEKERIRNSPPDLQFNIENIKDSDNQMKYIFHIENKGGPAKDVGIEFSLIGYANSSYEGRKQQLTSIETTEFGKLTSESGSKKYEFIQTQIDTCQLFIVYYEEITRTRERIKKIFKKNENDELILSEGNEKL